MYGVMTEVGAYLAKKGYLRCLYYYYYYYYLYHKANTVLANIMATQTHSPVPLISKGLMVKELLHVLLATLYMVPNGL